MNHWSAFWIDKGKNMEWSPESILNSKGLSHLSSIILEYLGKSSFSKLSLLELGSGMGITSMFFGHKGAKVTLLDQSSEARPLANEYWGKFAKHKFICADLFKFKSKIKYDIVSSWGLCEHFIGSQRNEVLQKHLDFLKSGGVAVISVPHKWGIFYRITKKLSELAGYWAFELEVPFSRNELISFAKRNNSKYTIVSRGFYSSAYDLFVRKPLKVLGIKTKRRFDNALSVWDSLFGGSLILILNKS